MPVEYRACSSVCRARRTVHEVNNTKNATAQTKVSIEVTCPEGREGGCEANVLGGATGGDGEGVREGRILCVYGEVRGIGVCARKMRTNDEKHLRYEIQSNREICVV